MINKKLLLSVLSIGTLVLGAVAPVTALAADNRVEDSNATVTFKENNTGPTDPVDPENPDIPGPNPGTGEKGPLSIDYVSDFDFGTHDIPTADTTYTALDDNGVANYVQVTDQRAGTPKGWSLTVSQKGQFTDGTDQLTGAAITIGNGDTRTPTNNYPESNKTVTSTTNANLALNPDGTTLNVMNAKAGGGSGTWVDAFGTKGSSTVKLMGPAAAHPNATKYNTTLTWSLADTPTNS